jgi:hypothetical protein
MILLNFEEKKMIFILNFFLPIKCLKCSKFIHRVKYDGRISQFEHGKSKLKLYMN